MEKENILFLEEKKNEEKKSKENEESIWKRKTYLFVEKKTEKGKEENNWR